MKAIQITFDKDTLARLDADEEVQREGRSAVLRRAAVDYLRRREREKIAAQYRQAYGVGGNLGDEFEGWEDEGTWPSE